MFGHYLTLLCEIVRKLKKEMSINVCFVFMW